MGQIIRKRIEFSITNEKIEFNYRVIGGTCGDIKDIQGFCNKKHDLWKIEVWVDGKQDGYASFYRVEEAEKYFLQYCELEAWLEWDK